MKLQKIRNATYESLDAAHLVAKSGFSGPAYATSFCARAAYIAPAGLGLTLYLATNYAANNLYKSKVLADMANIVRMLLTAPKWEE